MVARRGYRVLAGCGKTPWQAECLPTIVRKPVILGGGEAVSPANWPPLALADTFNNESVIDCHPTTDKSLPDRARCRWPQQQSAHGLCAHTAPLANRRTHADGFVPGTRVESSARGERCGGRHHGGWRESSSRQPALAEPKIDGDLAQRLGQTVERVCLSPDAFAPVQLRRIQPLTECTCTKLVPFWVPFRRKTERNRPLNGEPVCPPSGRSDD